MKALPLLFDIDSNNNNKKKTGDFVTIIMPLFKLS